MVVKLCRQLFIRSKIQFFESKSQLDMFESEILRGCLSDQRYNFLKANHNCFRRCKALLFVVYQIKDTIFWKQITTSFNRVENGVVLFIRSKIQFFESKSQQCKLFACTCKVVYQIKDTIFWKQITTVLDWVVMEGMLFIRSKIQFFESKSQRMQAR